MSGQRTVSILFSDVVGSTELRGSLGDQRADEVLRAHHRGQCAAVVARSGTIVKALGDGLMAVFDSAADALDAAAEMQEATAVAARESRPRCTARPSRDRTRRRPGRGASQGRARRSHLDLGMIRVWLRQASSRTARRGAAT